MEFHLTRTLPHSAARVLDGLAGAERHPEWMPGVRAVHPVAGDDPATWIEERVRFGRTMTERYQVAERGENLLVLEVEGDEDSARRGTWRFVYRTETAPEGTQLTVHGTGEGLGTVGRVAGRFLVTPFRRAVEEDLEALERWLRP